MEMVTIEHHTTLRHFLVGFIALFLTQLYFPTFLPKLLIKGTEVAEVNFIIIFGYVVGIGFFFGLAVNLFLKLIENERSRGKHETIDKPVFKLLNETVFGKYNLIEHRFSNALKSS